MEKRKLREVLRLPVGELIFGPKEACLSKGVKVRDVGQRNSAMVMISRQHYICGLPDLSNAFLRVGTISHNVPQQEESIRFFPFRLLQEGLERFQVAVDIRADQVPQEKSPFGKVIWVETPSQIPEIPSRSCAISRPLRSGSFS